MTDENVRTASDRIAREANAITEALVEALGLNGGDAVAGVINQDLICMVFGIHYSEGDDFAVLTATQDRKDEVFSYYCEASGAPEESEAVRNMRLQIDWYAESGFTGDGIVKDTVRRLDWYFQKGSVPSYGMEAPELPAITDLSTALGAIENTLKNTLPGITAETLGRNGEPKAGVNFESVTLEKMKEEAEETGRSGEVSEGSEEERGEEEGDSAPYRSFVMQPAPSDGEDEEDEGPAEMPFTERPHIDQAYAEKLAEEDDFDAKPLGMKFHMFWVQFGLPLTVMLAGMDALLGLFQVFQGNYGAITNVLIRGGVLIFGIPALKGMRKFSRQAFIKNSTLIFYSMGVKIINIVMLGMNFAAAPSYVAGVFQAGSEQFTEAGVTAAMLLSDIHTGLYVNLAVTIVTSVFWACLFVYYRKRRKYFKY